MTTMQMPTYTATAADMKEAAERVLANYERDAEKLRRYNLQRLARKADLDVVHIKELARTDFFGHLRDQLERIAKEKAIPST